MKNIRYTILALAVAIAALSTSVFAQAQSAGKEKAIKTPWEILGVEAEPMSQTPPMDAGGTPVSFSQRGAQLAAKFGQIKDGAFYVKDVNDGRRQDVPLNPTLGLGSKDKNLITYIVAYDENNKPTLRIITLRESGAVCQTAVYSSSDYKSLGCQKPSLWQGIKKGAGDLKGDIKSKIPKKDKQEKP